MPAHYGIALIPDAHKNALNAVLALYYNGDPATVDGVTQPANATGYQNDAFTHWYGGKTYGDTELSFFQNLADHIPAASWPIAGASGSVSLADAQAAAAAMILTVTTQASFTTEQAQQTLAAALGAQSLQKINWDG